MYINIFKSYIKYFKIFFKKCLDILVFYIRKIILNIRLIKILLILNTEMYIYFMLIFLLLLSITSGYLLSDIFLGLSSNFFYNNIYINPVQNQIFFEKYFEIFFIKIIPLIISFFFFFFFINLIFY